MRHFPEEGGAVAPPVAAGAAPRLAAHVAVPAPASLVGGAGRGIVVAPVEGSCVALWRALCLRGAAAHAFEALRAGRDPHALLATAAERGLLPDARAFLEELAGQGLLAVAPPLPPAERFRPRLEARDLDGLARVVLARGLRLRYRVVGRSMRPWIPNGSVVEATRVAFEAVRCGDVALFTSEAAALVAHRVVGRRGGLLLARGDAAPGLDRIAPDELRGVVTACAPPGEGWRAVSGGWRRAVALAGGVAWRAGQGLRRRARG